MDTAIASEAAFAVHDDAFLDVLGPAPRAAWEAQQAAGVAV
jgi:hypothetical protein